MKTRFTPQDYNVKQTSPSVNIALIYRCLFICSTLSSLSATVQNTHNNLASVFSGGRAERADRVRLVSEGGHEALFSAHGLRAQELLQREVFRRVSTRLLQTQQGKNSSEAGAPAGFLPRVRTLFF